MKFLFIFFIYLLIGKFSFADQLNRFSWDSRGNIIRQETIQFPSGKKFISLKHSGGFETSIAKYGSYSCSGNIFYNEKNNLENMSYACEFKDQDGDKFYSVGSRKKGSDIDRSLGKMSILEGQGFWKKYEGKVCTYGLENVDNVIFVKSLCK